MKRLIFALTLVASLASCGRETVYVRETIPLVNGILSDTDSDTYRFLSGIDRLDSRASVYVVGSRERSIRLCERMMHYDSRDNADGSMLTDALPDFSGEKISVILDLANEPYGQKIDSGDEDYLREVTVRNCLMALDTLCYLSPYDQEGLGSKSPAKLIILSSSYGDAFGLFDADTLLRSTGCAVKILSPLSAMLSRLFASHEGSLNIGIISNRGVLASGIYESVFADAAAKHGRAMSECVVYSTDDGGDALLSFLDNYLEDGNTRPLDAILVDDFSIDVAAMEKTLARVTSVMSEESLTYKNIISADFEVLDGETAVIEESLDILRARNAFSHNIHYPKAEWFATAAVPEQRTDIEGGYMLIQYTQDDVQK